MRRTVLTIFLGGITPLSVSLVPVAQAQRPTAAASGMAMDPTPVAPFADPDSTRNIPGHVTFTRYTTPGQCLGAVLSAQRELVRDPGRDTLFGPASMTDPFPSTVRDIGERCRAQVTSPSVGPSELQNVFVLATLLYDTASGDAARERWLAMPQTFADRGETSAETRAKRIDSAIQNYVYIDLAGPLRGPYGARAHALFAQLDAMGQPARNQRLAMQEYLLQRERGWTVQQTGWMQDPRQELREWLAFLAGIDSVGGIAGPAKYGASGLPPVYGVLNAQFLLDRTKLVSFADSVTRAMPKLGAIAVLLSLSSHSMVAGTGKTVPPLHGGFWYNAGSDTLWPSPGRFSLLVHNDLSLQEAALVRRIATRYGPHGLRMLVVVKTKGYWNRNGTETGPRTAAQEATQDSAFYLGYLKLPTALLVQEAQFQQQSNGWWVQTAPVQYEREWEAKGGGGLANRMVMVDSAGRLFAQLPLNEAYAYAYLDQMMGLDTHYVASPPSATPPPATPSR
jgi:hypothetical protein